jgi:hypothetical protein
VPTRVQVHALEVMDVDSFKIDQVMVTRVQTPPPT